MPTAGEITALDLAAFSEYLCAVEFGNVPLTITGASAGQAICDVA
jgi:hypothetical protein